MVDIVLAVAAALTLGVAFAHSYLGERYILGPLLPRELPPMPAGRKFSARTIRVAWHVTSVAWLGLAWVLLHPERPSMVLLAISATFAATGLAIAGFSRGRHLAWPVFLLIAVLVYWASTDLAP
jgi:hypothetical protein